MKEIYLTYPNEEEGFGFTENWYQETETNLICSAIYHHGDKLIEKSVEVVHVTMNRLYIKEL